MTARYPESKYDIEFVARSFTSLKEPDIMMLQLAIFPLPKGLKDELQLFIRNHVNAFLTEAGLTLGHVTVISDSDEDPPEKVLP